MTKYVSFTASLIALAVALASLALAVFTRQQTNRTDPDRWTHRDVRNHLERSGLRYRLAHEDGKNFLIDAAEPLDNDALLAASASHSGPKGKPVVRLTWYDSTAKARHIANEVPAGVGCESWHHFVITGDPERVARVVAALP